MASKSEVAESVANGKLLDGAQANPVDAKVDESGSGAGESGSRSNKIDLSNSPEFRAAMSSRDKELNALRAQNQQMQEALEKLQVRLETQDMTENERKRYLEEREVQVRGQTLSQREQQLAAREAELRKMEILGQIANKMDVPISALRDATSESEAWSLAVDYQRSNQGKKQADRTEKAAANAPDLGGRAVPGDDFDSIVGRASSPQELWAAVLKG